MEEEDTWDDGILPHLKRVKVLGKGGFGRVFLAKKIEDGECLKPSQTLR